MSLAISFPPSTTVLSVGEIYIRLYEVKPFAIYTLVMTPLTIHTTPSDSGFFLVFSLLILQVNTGGDTLGH